MKSTRLILLLQGLMCFLAMESLCTPLHKSKSDILDDLRGYRGDHEFVMKGEDGGEKEGEEEGGEGEEEGGEGEEKEGGDDEEEDVTDESDVGNESGVAVPKTTRDEASDKREKVGVSDEDDEGSEDDDDGEEEDTDEDDDDEEEEEEDDDEDDEDDDDYDDDDFEDEDDDEGDEGEDTVPENKDQRKGASGGATGGSQVPTKNSSGITVESGASLEDEIAHFPGAPKPTDTLSGSSQPQASLARPAPIGGAGSESGRAPIILPIVFVPFDMDTNRVRLPARMQSHAPAYSQPGHRRPAGRPHLHFAPPSGYAQPPPVYARPPTQSTLYGAPDSDDMQLLGVPVGL